MVRRLIVLRALLGAAALALPFACSRSLDVDATTPREAVVAKVQGASAPVGKRLGPAFRFEVNAGQFSDRVQYVGRGRGLSVVLGDEGVTFALATPSAGRRLAMRVVHRTGTSAPVASEPLETRSNYFVGNDRSRWRTDVPSFGRVTYRDVIRGVDQVFHGEDGALEYDFVVAPGARPESLEIAFEGADSLAIDARGDLRITVGHAVLVETKPTVYQRKDGRELALRASYRLTGSKSVAFDVGDYDHASPLIIDPVLTYSTYLGGSGNDYGYGIALDSSGAMYVAGSTTSMDFPITDAYDGLFSGTEDAFVAKLSNTGDALVYATYLGGSQGAYGYGIAVDASGSAYVVGVTSSPDFPVNGAYDRALSGDLDAFITKLSPSGSAIAYSTYLGGSDNDFGYGIALDESDAAYVVGTTYSADFPTLLASQPSYGGSADAFITKLSPSGATLLYSTYLGGTQTESGSGIAVDSADAAYVTGFTTSLDFPVAPLGPFQALNAGNQSAFVTKVSAGGAALVYSTYLGGSQSDQGNAIAVDGSGAAYVTGSATSPDFPTDEPYQPALRAPYGSSNAFVTKLAPTGTALAYSTFLGGSGADFGAGIALNGLGEAYVTGVTTSTDFPTLNAFQTTLATDPVENGTNAFVTRILAGGSALIYSTYLGGSVGDTAQSIAVGPDESAFVAGFTASPDFPTVAPLDAHLTSQTGVNAFVAIVANRDFEGDAAVGTGDGAADATADGQESTSHFPADAAEPAMDAFASPETFDVDGGGCSCRAAPSGGERWGERVLLAVGGLVWLARRRR